MLDRAKLVDVRLDQSAGHVLRVAVVVGVLSLLSASAKATTEAAAEEPTAEAARGRHGDAAAYLPSDLVQPVPEGRVNRDHDQREPHAHRKHGYQQTRT